MTQALLLSEAQALDFADIRSNVTRIPEVVQRIRAAQGVWDQGHAEATGILDLANFIASEDSVYLSNIKLRKLTTAIVQMGLYDRLMRVHKLPEFIIGMKNGDSALQVISGQMTFEQMIQSSVALSQPAQRFVVISSAESMPLLAGVQIPEAALYQQVAAGQFQEIDCGTRDLNKLLLQAVERFDLQQLVCVGPGHGLPVVSRAELVARDVRIIESLDLDPMLGWFWSQLRQNSLAMAN